MANIVLVGARTARQGTGPFLANGLVAAGARIGGIVGTRQDTVAQALASLHEQSNIACAGYTDLAQALAAERPDAVVLCSPWQFHASQLALVADAGCHCLVEKPLAWPATTGEVDDLVATFERRGLLLQMVAQWPCSLPCFAELHGALPDPVATFSMRLSPISVGPDMITDAAPHFIAMLQALVGQGDFEDITVSRSGEEQLELQGHYRHVSGATAARLQLATSPERPRPAWYEINGLRAAREVELPAYRQYLCAGGDRVFLPDPMHTVASEFMQNLRMGRPTDGDLLRGGHQNLLQLAACGPD